MGQNTREMRVFLKPLAASAQRMTAVLYRMDGDVSLLRREWHKVIGDFMAQDSFDVLVVCR